MANVKITDLTEDTTPADGDWVETVDISAGASKKVTRTNFFLNPPYGAGSIGATNSQLAAGIACQMVYNTDTAVATGTTTMPADDTIPQNTEGNQFMTQAITPKSATNILVIEATLFIAFSASTADISAALFQDSTANAIAAAAGFYQETANRIFGVTIRHIMVAGTTSATTFKVRVGSPQIGTVTFNGVASGRRYGAIPKSTMTITEYKAS